MGQGLDTYLADRGLERELAKTGDYITTTLGRELILCTRGNDDKIRAFYNVCQHRGMQLVAEPSGNLRRLTCPYHGWAYDMEERSRPYRMRTTFLRAARAGNSIWWNSPVKFGRALSGIIMDADCASLKTFLGPIADQIDTYPMDGHDPNALGDG